MIIVIQNLFWFYEKLDLFDWFCNLKKTDHRSILLTIKISFRVGCQSQGNLKVHDRVTGKSKYVLRSSDDKRLA